MQTSPAPHSRQTPSGATTTPGTASDRASLIAEGERLFDAREIERAEAVFREALQRAEQQQDAATQGRALVGLGRIDADRDRRSDAKRTFERALTLFRAAGDEGGEAQAKIAAGLNLSSRGDRAEAARLITEARDTLRRLGDIEYVARASAALMIVLPTGPDKDRAREAAFEDARRSSRRLHECTIRYAWARDLLRAGDYAAAQRTYKDAAACYEPLPREPRLSGVFLGLGDVERVHGQFESALAHYQRALEISRQTNSPTGVIAATTAVAVAQAALWRTDEARATLESALALARERRAETFIPYVVGTLGGYLLQLKQYRDAIPLLQESLDGAADPRFKIERLMQLGNAHGHIGEVTRALEFCDRAVALARETDPPQLMHALRWRGEVRRLAGDVDGAAADLRDGIVVVEDLRRKTVPIDFMKRGFSEWHQWLFGSSIALSMQKGQVRDAIETAERARARAFLDLLATRDVTTASPEPTASTMPAASVAASAVPAGSSAAGSTSADAASSAHSSRSAISPPGSASPTRPAAARSAPATTSAPANPAAKAANGASLSPRGQRGAATIGVEAAAANAPVAAESSDRTNSGDATRAREAAGAREATGAREAMPMLPSSEAAASATLPEMIATAARLRSTLLVYWAGFESTFIWVIAPDGAVHHAEVDVSLARLTSLAAATRTPAGADVGGAGMFALARPSQRKSWRELHDLLIAPVRTHLPKDPDALVTIVPHGPLFQLSFAALQDERGRYLLERHRLHYTPAVGVLAYTARRRETRETQPTARGGDGDGGALLVGDPGELPDAAGSGSLSALPWARREVAEVAALLPARERDATVLVDAQASEAEVRAQAPGRRLLHFATHGVVRQAEELSSFLALRGAEAIPSAKEKLPAPEGQPAAAAGGGPSPSSADGRLTANEVYELKLDADLVVLSACSSALGPMTGDGVIGFTRAFLYAGASSVIASAWDVPDAAGYELMRRFYRARRTAPDASRALRAAQLATLGALRRGTLKAATAGGDVALPEHPLFWAGFVIVGEP